MAANKDRKYKNLVWSLCKKVLGSYNYEIIRGYYNLGYLPNIKNPKTFNEKIMHKKFFQNMDFAVELADKHKVRDFVAKKIGDQHLIKLLYVGDDLHKVDWRSLPDQFIIKTNNGGGEEGNIIIRDKNSIDILEINKRVTANLNKPFGYWTNENWYLKIPPKIIIEELLFDENGDIPNDFKLFCFHGKCHYVQVVTDRFANQTRSYFTPNWEYQSFSLAKTPTINLPEPPRLKELVAIAEKLAAGFDFIRVDLYNVSSGIFFGEMTFTPNGGHDAFHPREMDYTFGALI